MVGDCLALSGIMTEAEGNTDVAATETGKCNFYDTKAKQSTLQRKYYSI